MPTDTVIAVIPARWASTRFPGKPLAPLCGKPMIQWVVEQAEKAAAVSAVWVATDDARIEQAVTEFGGRAVMTCADHASGTDRIAEAVADEDAGIVVNVQGDEPMIPPENIDAVVTPLLAEPGIEVATLAMPIHSKEDMQNPDVTKVVFDKQGRALYFSRAPIPHNRDGERDAEASGPFGHKHIGLYAYRKSFLMQFPELKPSRMEQREKLEQLRILDNGHAIHVVETEKDSIGVDREADLLAVEKRLNEAIIQ